MVVSQENFPHDDDGGGCGGEKKKRGHHYNLYQDQVHLYQAQFKKR
jgi:hypothetical protein